MSITDVIAELEKVRAEHGDIPVVVYDGGYISDLVPASAFDLINGNEGVIFPLGAGTVEKVVRVC